MTNRFLLLALLVAAQAGAWRPAAAQVKVWQGTLTLPTYEEGPPDPNPPFDIYATARFNYPYTIRTNLTGVKADHAWRAIFIENEYLKCTVLPDIGGHLYTCTDKISGQPIFYANPSIKKAQIGYRGAWAAFGVEYNFPVSHNWVSMSPVDFAYATHEDGSASVWVGNIDRPYGMEWQVELVLRPGSTLMEERVTLNNRGDVRHRYYWWMNAGVQVWDDSRIEYPMRFVASHGFTNVYLWPIGPDDRDLSVIGNQTSGPMSFFAHGTREPFMGIWNPKTQTGMAHFAEYRDLPAKKIWAWGVNAAGLAWRNVLSDNDSAYAEVQAGLFRNQETYAFLEPGQTVRFSEYWMPVRGTGGISRATKAGVVSLSRHGAELTVALNVNERLEGAQISLSNNGTSLWSETAGLSPEKTWSHTVSASDETARVTFELKDREGRTLLKQTEGEYDWDPESEIKTGPQETEHIPEPESRTEDDWLQVGRDQELNGKTVLALATYERALEKFPRSQSLEAAAGRLAVSRQHYEEAERWLKLAQERNTPDAEIAYSLGLAEDALGREREAETAYEIAYRQAGRRVAAAIRLGELRARAGDVEGAAAYFRAALDADVPNSRAREELGTVLRANGRRAEADKMAGLGLSADPMSDFLKADTGKPDLEHLAADPYRVLRVADEYMRLGLYRQALGVLERNYPAVAADQSEPGSVLPQNHPLVLYYAAYCKQKLGEVSGRDWQTASELSPSLVFPSTAADRVVLEAAIAANANDATAHFLLGTLLFSKGLTDAGMAHWAEAKKLAPHLAAIDADMGDAWLRVKADPQRALASYREGLKNDPENPEIYAGLDAALSLTGATAGERADALAQFPGADAPGSKMPANLVYQLALTRAEAGRFEQALALFAGRFFPSEEGGVTSAEVQFEIRLMQAEAWASAGDCARAGAFVAAEEPEMSREPKSARQYFKMAGVARGCGRTKDAGELLHQAAASTNPADLGWAVTAARFLGRFETEKPDQRLALALAVAESIPDKDSVSGAWWYETGLVQACLHRMQEAKASFERALTLPDTHMSHHLAREALAEFAGSGQVPAGKR